MARDPQLRRRRNAVQRRSRETVGVIRTAAAQVFAARGYQRATTNRIAERAGVSIGTLYQYFPNKAALLVDLMEHHLGEAARRVSSGLERAAQAESTTALLRGFVDALLSVHARDQALHRALFEDAPHPAELHDCVLGLERSMAHQLARALQGRPDVRVADVDTASHLIVQAAEALVHRFVLHGIHDVDRQRFTEELVRLFAGYLGAALPPGASSPSGSRERASSPQARRATQEEDGRQERGKGPGGAR